MCVCVLQTFCTSLKDIKNSVSVYLCPTNKNSVFCQNQVESEDHFLLVCPLYTDVRHRFLEQKGIQSLQNIFRRKNTKGCRLLSKFSFHAINRRKLDVDV